MRVKGFQMVGHPAHKTSPKLTIDHTVIVAMRQEHHLPNGDHIPFGCFNHSGRICTPVCKSSCVVKLTTIDPWCRWLMAANALGPQIWMGFVW